MTSAFTVRTMRAGDLDTALEWARQEGWNPGLEDAPAFLAADPSGFFVGVLGDRPVGCISVVKYGADFAFVGLYIVHPDFRGQGYGKAIWETALTSAGRRTIGLDGVPAQQQNYARSGFNLDYRTVRHGGVATVTPPGHGEPVVELFRPAHLDGVMRYDAGIFPGPRSSFLAAWLEPADTRVSVVATEGGQVRGYGTIRRCFEGCKIGPLFADDADCARAIFAALVGQAEGLPVFIDVPQSNGPAVALADAFGLAPVFETARMYRGPAPVVPLDRVFGISTLELG